MMETKIRLFKTKEHAAIEQSTAELQDKALQVHNLKQRIAYKILERVTEIQNLVLSDMRTGKAKGIPHYVVIQCSGALAMAACAQQYDEITLQSILNNLLKWDI